VRAAAAAKLAAEKVAAKEIVAELKQQLAAERSAAASGGERALSAADEQAKALVQQLEAEREKRALHLQSVAARRIGQQALAKGWNGYLPGELWAAGAFGPTTTNGMQAWQREAWTFHEATQHGEYTAAARGDAVRTQSLVRRVSAIQQRCDGGSGALDVECQIDALKLTWIVRLLDTSTQPWKGFVWEQVHEQLGWAAQGERAISSSLPLDMKRH
jgi:hypothetical protein